MIQVDRSSTFHHKGIDNSTSVLKKQPCLQRTHCVLAERVKRIPDGGGDRNYLSSNSPGRAAYPDDSPGRVVRVAAASSSGQFVAACTSLALAGLQRGAGFAAHGLAHTRCTSFRTHADATADASDSLPSRLPAPSFHQPLSRRSGSRPNARLLALPDRLEHGKRDERRLAAFRMFTRHTAGCWPWHWMPWLAGLAPATTGTLKTLLENLIPNWDRPVFGNNTYHGNSRACV